MLKSSSEAHDFERKSRKGRRDVEKSQVGRLQDRQQILPCGVECQSDIQMRCAVVMRFNITSKGVEESLLRMNKRAITGKGSVSFDTTTARFIMWSWSGRDPWWLFHVEVWSWQMLGCKIRYSTK